MDYDFVVDDYGSPMAIFSVGHEAIGLWFREELGRDQSAIAALLENIDRVENRVLSQYQIQGKDFQLSLERTHISVVSFALHAEVDEPLPEDTNLYDQESSAECGLIDFKQALILWQDFIRSI